MAAEVNELKKRIKILNIPVDIIPHENLETLIKGLWEDEGKHQIIFLRTRDLMRARRNADFETCVRKASLIVPVSRSILWASRVLKRDAVVRHMPFDFVIRILGILEKYDKSVYLIGQKPNSLHMVSGNLRTSFPGLKQVGRYAGYYKKEMEQNILLAIKKAAPTLLLAGEGIPGKDLWVMKQAPLLNPGIALWSGECFAIFSGRKSRTPRKQWEKGVDTFPETLRKPWRFLRGVIYLYFFLLVLLHRLRKM